MVREGAQAGIDAGEGGGGRGQDAGVTEKKSIRTMTNEGTRKIIKRKKQREKTNPESEEERVKEERGIDIDVYLVRDGETERGRE